MRYVCCSRSVAAVAFTAAHQSILFATITTWSLELLRACFFSRFVRIHKRIPLMAAFVSPAYVEPMRIAGACVAEIAS